MRRWTAGAVVTACFVALLMFLAAPYAMAQQGQAGEGEGPLQQRLQQRWEMVKQRIELATSRFNNNKERHVKAYGQVKAKVEKILQSLKDKGYDVSKLASDLAVWDEKIQKFTRDYASLIQKLEEILALTPEQAQGDFAALISEARRLLHTVRQDALDIRLFYQQTIRADIQELRAQLPEAA